MLWCAGCAPMFSRFSSMWRSCRPLRAVMEGGRGRAGETRSSGAMPKPPGVKKVRECDRCRAASTSPRTAEAAEDAALDEAERRCDDVAAEERRAADKGAAERDGAPAPLPRLPLLAAPAAAPPPPPPPPPAWARTPLTVDVVGVSAGVRDAEGDVEPDGDAPLWLVERRWRDGRTHDRRRPGFAASPRRRGTPFPGPVDDEASLMVPSSRAARDKATRRRRARPALSAGLAACTPRKQQGREKRAFRGGDFVMSESRGVLLLCSFMPSQTRRSTPQASSGGQRAERISTQDVAGAWR